MNATMMISLLQNPLNGGTPEIESEAIEHVNARHRHLADQPAHLVAVPRPRAVLERARAEEEERLEHGVVHEVVEPAEESRRRDQAGGTFGLSPRPSPIMT